MTTAELISQECDAIKAMLLDKNARYGDSAMQPRRIFSGADHLEQLKVRIDDKLSRIATMGPDSEDEDTTGDLIGYLVLLRIARRRARQGEVVDDERSAGLSKEIIAPVIAPGITNGTGRLTCPLCGDTYVHEGDDGSYWCESCGPHEDTDSDLVSMRLETVHHKGETDFFWTVTRVVKESLKTEPWQSAIPEQDVQRREQAAHGAGYIIPQMEDGDDDPAVVHVVPDRTSRNATLTPDTVLPLPLPGELVDHPDVVRARRLPDECLGAMCGRVRG